MDKMSNASEIISGSVDLVDDLTTSQEEELATLERLHSVDMTSDSWLSKNIRPMFLIFSCVGWLIALLLSSTGHKVDDTVIVVLERWGELAAVFYFGSRGWEKVERTKMKRAAVESKIDRKEKRIEARLKRKGLL